MKSLFDGPWFARALIISYEPVARQVLMNGSEDILSTSLLKVFTKKELSLNPYAQSLLMEGTSKGDATNNKTA